MQRKMVAAMVAVLAWFSAGDAQQRGNLSLPPTAFIEADVSTERVELGAATLRQVISLDLQDASFEDALREVSRQIGGRLMYDEAARSVDRRLTLRQDGIAVGEALKQMLAGTDLEAIAPAGASLILLKRVAPPAVVQDTTGTIRGRVVEVGSGGPVAHVLVSGSGREAGRQTTTDANGRFLLRGMSAGRNELTFRRLGYENLRLTLQLGSGQDTTIVVELPVAAIPLMGIVTTGTGERRRLEVGNSTVTMNADSIMAVTPVSTVSQLIANRIPGLLATTNSGAVGSPTRLRMRGMSSIESNNEPIIVVDGVRLANSVSTSLTNTLYAGVHGGSQQAGANNLSMRLDDIDPNSIESIEILKGPAASTMYGAEAANGVIIIKTKRGHAGPARWSIYTDYKQLAQVKDYEYPVQQIGYPLSGGAALIPSCRIADQYLGNCIPEEGNVRGFNMLQDPRFTPQGRGYTRSTGANVSGGAQELQYYIGGTFLDQLGTTKMPEVNRVWIENGRGGQPIKEELLRPNARSNASMNARITGQVGRTADFALGTNFISQQQRVGSDGSSGLLAQPRLPSDTTPVIEGWQTWYGSRKQDVKHIIGNASGNWRPNWRNNALALTVGYGWDFALKDDEYYAPRGSCDPLCQGTSDQGILGYVNSGRRSDHTQSFNVGSSFILPVSSWLTTTTRAGFNFNKTKWSDLYGQSVNLRVGVKHFAPSGTQRITELGDTRATAGWYLEEQVNLRDDRLFVTGGLRQDAGSSIGETVKPIYPKLNTSWLVSEEPFFPFSNQVSLFRARFAMGSAGIMPSTTARNRTYAMASNFVLDDGSPTGFFAELGSPGNPDLKAEHSREWESGFDMELLDRRLAFDFTYYRKFTRDAIHRGPVAGSVGPSVVRALLSNLGDVQNQGFELGSSLRLVDTDALTYSITGNLTSRQNRLVRLADGVVTFQSMSASGDLYTGNEARLMEGYPLFGRWAYPILGWADRDGNGVIDPLEVIVGDSMVYVGPSEPRYTGYIGNQMGVLNNRVTIAANFAYSTGMTQFNQARKNMSQYAPVGQALASDLRDQACVVAAFAQGHRRSTDWCFMETFTLLRFQDFSVGYNLPGSTARLIGASSGSLRFSANNLKLWSNYKGGDPMVSTSPVTGNAVLAGPAFPAPREYGMRLQLFF
jgi:TonB-dependent SusC/RagA subfamily outer membrane receptor